MSAHRGRLPIIGALLLAALQLLGAGTVLAAEITPFQSFDQSPLVQIFGLPAAGSAKILPRGVNEARVVLDLASNFAESATSHELILLDGESLRSTLSVSRGFGERFEAGIELPIVTQGGGFMDGFIEGWHQFFGLPQGGRLDAPGNRLLYLYNRDGTTRMSLTRGSTGLGDLRLTGGGQLYRTSDTAVALRGSLKLPTGDSAELLGSGSTDLALWLSADRDFRFAHLGHAAVFGALGALGKTRGDVLPSQERSLVGFGTVGAGWSPTKTLAFKLQLSAHTPFYRDSDLVELNAFSTLLLIGGTVAFTEATALDIGVSEDVAVLRSPDVDFHLALTTRF